MGRRLRELARQRTELGMALTVGGLEIGWEVQVDTTSSII
jgi:hypothetical protein